MCAVCCRHEVRRARCCRPWTARSATLCLHMAAVVSPLGEVAPVVASDCSEHCLAWAAAGECRNNPIHMRSCCEHACRQRFALVGEMTPAGEDAYFECYTWAQQGMCLHGTGKIPSGERIGSACPESCAAIAEKTCREHGGARSFGVLTSGTPRSSGRVAADDFFVEESALPLVSFAIFAPDTSDEVLANLGFEAVHRYLPPPRRQLRLPSLAHDPPWRGWARGGLGGGACHVRERPGELQSRKKRKNGAVRTHVADREARQAMLVRTPNGTSMFEGFARNAHGHIFAGFYPHTLGLRSDLLRMRELYRLSRRAPVSFPTDAVLTPLCVAPCFCFAAHRCRVAPHFCFAAHRCRVTPSVTACDRRAASRSSTRSPAGSQQPATQSPQLPSARLPLTPWQMVIGS